jgi:hypothetical protein
MPPDMEIALPAGMPVNDPLSGQAPPAVVLAVAVLANI